MFLLICSRSRLASGSGLMRTQRRRILLSTLRPSFTTGQVFKGVSGKQLVDMTEAESQEPVPEVDMTEADVTEAHADPKHYRNKRQGNISKRGIPCAGRTGRTRT